MPPSPRLSPVSDSPSSSSSENSSNEPRSDPSTEVITFDPLPSQSLRTALILDRFTVNCTVIYCSNDNLVATTTVMGRSFFDFVAQKDEDIVRSWIDVIKGWGVNERGQPSDGGFGFGKFTLCKEGRDSSCVSPVIYLDDIYFIYLLSPFKKFSGHRAPTIATSKRVSIKPVIENTVIPYGISSWRSSLKTTTDPGIRR
jgi:hypothetical protein